MTLLQLPRQTMFVCLSGAERNIFWAEKEGRENLKRFKNKKVWGDKYNAKKL